MNNLGIHLIVDFYDCDGKILNSKEFIEKSLIKAVKISGATILNIYTHKFVPQGISTIIALSESHISIHTFPEYKSATLDFYTCGSCNPHDGLYYLIKKFNPLFYNLKEIERGKKQNNTKE